MGTYINPQDMTKEEWLILHGTEIIIPSDKYITEDTVVVCLVNNGPFTAAAVAYDLNELNYFKEPGDTRPKHWYTVSVSDLDGVV